MAAKNDVYWPFIGQLYCMTSFFGATLRCLFSPSYPMLTTKSRLFRKCSCSRTQPCILYKAAVAAAHIRETWVAWQILAARYEHFSTCYIVFEYKSISECSYSMENGFEYSLPIYNIYLVLYSDAAL